MIRVIEEFPKLLSVLNYFERNYLGRLSDRLDFDSSTFHIDQWNFYDSVIKSKGNCQKTNNKIEGWHRSFNALNGCKKPQMYIYVNSIKKVQADTNFVFDKLLKDVMPEKRRRLDVVAKTHEQLYDVVQQYKSYEDKLVYMEDIAKLLGHPVSTH